MPHTVESNRGKDALLMGLMLALFASLPAADPSRALLHTVGGAILVVALTFRASAIPAIARTMVPAFLLADIVFRFATHQANLRGRLDAPAWITPAVWYVVTLSWQIRNDMRARRDRLRAV